jgi:hypothetical protein
MPTSEPDFTEPDAYLAATVPFYARSGRKISLYQFGRLLAWPGYRHVDRNVIGPYLVSTVWLGISVTPPGLGAPQMFESGVFLEKERAGLEDLAMTHHGAEDTARHAHIKHVLIASHAWLNCGKNPSCARMRDKWAEAVAELEESPF